MESQETCWKKGPLPPNTWHWGGVVLVGETYGGFYFADFHGDHVTIFTGDKERDAKKYQADEIAWYNNALTLPIPGAKGVAGRAQSGG